MPKIKYNGCSQTLAINIANFSYAGNLQNHHWYNARYTTEKGGLQAHHLITTGSINTPEWLEYQKLYKYDINSKDNGVMLPSSVQIACQVATHVHRSNHQRGINFQSVIGKYFNANIPRAIPDDIIEILYNNKRTYLHGIKKLLVPIRARAQKNFYCKNGNAKKFSLHMNTVSISIINKMNKFHWCISRYGSDYEKSSPYGCANGNIENESKKRKHCTSRQKTDNKKHDNKNKIGNTMIPMKLKVGS